MDEWMDGMNFWNLFRTSQSCALGPETHIHPLLNSQELTSAVLEPMYEWNDRQGKGKWENHSGRIDIDGRWGQEEASGEDGSREISVKDVCTFRTALIIHE